MIRLARASSVFLVAGLLLAGCTSSPDGDQNESASSDDTLGVYEKAEWSYSGDTGPEQWGTLSPAYAACDGSQQSPIDLTTPSEADGPAFGEAYSASTAEVIDTGHGIQVNTSGGTLTVDGTTYELLQFHVHTPSEHTVDGSSYPAEVHLVHKAPDGTLAVIGVFVEEGAENDGLNPWVQAEPDDGSALEYDVSALLPDAPTYYTYDGSLTTPPCSEVVRWIVMDETIEASPAQLDRLRDRHDGNARPVQPLGDRTLTRVDAE